MKILIQVIGSTITVAERQRLRRIIEKLSTHSKRIISVNAVVKKDSSDKTKGIHCELYLSNPGDNLFAKSKGSNSFEALAGATEGLRKQLRKTKTKRLNSRIK